mmetsp:Transcript_13308/g.18145  ORF Transcript_13308/g.18145 Transcript_13308/m.18145 type:complete len:99 (-) Transcript_13308:2462-2758(-)
MKERCFRSVDLRGFIVFIFVIAVHVLPRCMEQVAALRWLLLLVVLERLPTSTLLDDHSLILDKVGLGDGNSIDILHLVVLEVAHLVAETLIAQIAGIG